MLISDWSSDVCSSDLICHRKWWPFQPRRVTMAPRGHIHFHPESPSYCDCFASASIGYQGHLIHELVHVWQYQQGVNLILRRHPFCRYSYTRSEEHTSELQSLMRISYAVFCLKKKNKKKYKS